MKTKWCSVLMIVLLAGCAGANEKVKVAPMLKVSTVDIGHGQSVYANVYDQRPLRRGSTGEVAWLFQRQMDEALMRKGFKPASTPKGNAQLSVILEDFQYETTKGFFKEANRVQSRIKVVVEKAGHKYERTYQDGEEIKRVSLSRSQAEGDIFNYVVYEVLNQVFADEAMMKILAE